MDTYVEKGNVLLIHMGMPKTGTSAIQQFLYENQDNLDRVGWRYPNLANEVPLSWQCGSSPVNGEVFVKYELSEPDGKSCTRGVHLAKERDEWDLLWDRLLYHLEKSNVILSNEFFWNCAEEFLPLCKEKYAHVKAVIYLRRQDKLVESRWNQKVKSNAYCSMAFQDYINDPEVVTSLHYLRKIEAVGNIIGFQNLILKIYDKENIMAAERKEDGLIEDFLSAIQLGKNGINWNKCKMLNNSLDGKYLEVKRIWNSVFAHGISDRQTYYASEDLNDVFLELSEIFSDGKKRCEYFTPLGRRKFLEQFAQENREIASKYLKDEDKPLFLNMDTDSDGQSCVANDSLTESEKIMIRVLAGISKNINLKLLKLKRQSDNQAWKLIKNVSGERRLVFFGGG